MVFQKSNLKYIPENNISIPSSIRFNPDLNHGEKLFLAEVKSMQKKGGEIPYSSRKLSELFCASHQTVLNWTKHLCALKMIEIRIDRSQKDCHYFLKVIKKFD